MYQNKNDAFTFDIGESENDTISRKEQFMLYKTDIKNAIRIKKQLVNMAKFVINKFLFS